MPFEHVNVDARLVIVGITPGATQRDEACEAAGRLLRRGLPDGEILRQVKKLAAFGGQAMRPNLERMIDALDIMALLGGGRASELWGGRAHLLHATSVVPHAAFVKGKPFAGSFEEIQRVDVLRRSFERDFLPTLHHLRRDSYFIGLGPTPAAALSFAADKGLIDRSRILGWLAHPSTSGGSQVSIYLGEKKVEELKERDPVLLRAKALVAASANMRDRIAAAARSVAL
ncbi:hypothetical protein ACT4MK_36795 [Bradyrhizobium barranii]|uniref:hypothetical protein n=1 Tax=Bradyrhizobium TaxID=374 RepID=UPI003F2313F9